MKKLFLLIFLASVAGVLVVFLTGGPPLNTATFMTTKISAYTINKSLVYNKTKQQNYKEALIDCLAHGFVEQIKEGPKLVEAEELIRLSLEWVNGKDAGEIILASKNLENLPPEFKRKLLPLVTKLIDFVINNQDKTTISEELKSDFEDFMGTMVPKEEIKANMQKLEKDLGLPSLPFAK